jgi:hypothetical protein
MITAISSVVSEIASGRAFQLVFLIIMGILGTLSYELARRGRNWTVRSLEPLEAMKEGIGRAAETGRPILVLPGIGGLSSAQTIAGLTVYGEITQRAAEVGVVTHNITSSTDVVMASEAIARDAYSAIGKPELYEPGKYVKWFGQDQFVYAVGAAGHIMQEKPAMVALIGYFLADVVVTGETGNRVGAIVIGGTTDQSATPLMGMMCDYLLMGEEMYAASAAITGDRFATATLAGEDWIKLILLAIMVIGVLAWVVGFQDIYKWTGM